ncbi:sirohydrochlorin chelatase [Ramlibacter sp. PS4R-6]|uniref:sirohydrochlorin chelatase n=1 Tax=Ramlibacter sp. PS4R-6 TaxID=3133438 RepID=UPI0030A22D9C
MKRAIVLFGHGSRDPQWREPMDAVARRIRARVTEVEVRCAFLELDSPHLPAVAAELAGAGIDAIRVVPMFLGAGRHAREDLPRLVEECRRAHPTVAFDLRPSVGENAKVLDLLAQTALE